MNWKEILFTFFYTGYFPVAPGTAGALAGMGVYCAYYLAFGRHAWIVNAAVCVAAVYPSIRLCDEGERFFGRKDPSCVVLDEAVGYWTSVLFHPFSIWGAVIAFVFFRLADIVKPWPARGLQRLNGGLGIVIDDIVAGAYANLATFCVLWLAGRFGIQPF